MSSNLPKSRSEMLYREACEFLSKANPIQSSWDFVGYNSWSACVNTPGLELGVGGSKGCLTVQKRGAAQPLNVHTITGDMSVGISPFPFNAGFPMPLPSKGVI